MQSKNKLLIFIPTYNEFNNVENILNEILSVNLDADILFMDDNSPDGTGELLDSLSKNNQGVIIIHRPGKLGIGSAHRDGILWAYNNQYEKILTLDCDATHPPKYISDFLIMGLNYDIVVGSRHLSKFSLQDWSLRRKLLTKLGYWLTLHVLKIPYDATGAFRLYDLNRIDLSFLNNLRSKGYSFFFESLLLLHNSNYKIGEVSIHMPTRINDQSKMKYRDIFDSLTLIIILLFEKIFKVNNKSSK
jgi:dolichol-phosphate mannosyltransferase